MKQEWIEQLTPEDMPNRDMKMVAELCGVPVAINLIEQLQGVNVYVPKGGDMRMIRKLILKHYNGHNAKELALELKVTEAFVFKVMQDARGSASASQLTIFEKDEDNEWPQ